MLLVFLRVCLNLGFNITCNYNVNFHLTECNTSSGKVIKRKPGCGFNDGLIIIFKFYNVGYSVSMYHFN